MGTITLMLLRFAAEESLSVGQARLFGGLFTGRWLGFDGVEEKGSGLV
jgi:hypothetical protein